MTLIRYIQQSAPAPELPPDLIVFGRSSQMREIRHNLELIAKTDVPVLIEGESGTGKELVAQILHNESEQTAGKLVKISCPAIPETLLETELFGYEAGAFPGALAPKRGRIEQAEHGTLLLDEIEALDLAAQSKIMQVLQDGSFVRVGGRERRHVQTRVISIANCDLRQRVASGDFRTDLLYRVNVVTLSIPPLRHRLEDLPDLVEYLLQRHSAPLQTSPRPLSGSLLRLMQGYAWPGNIRQLENIIRRYVLLEDEELIVRELSPELLGTNEQVTAKLELSKPVSLKEITRQATHDLERQIILKVLEANGWNRQKTAKWLQISYRSLLYKLSGIGRTGQSITRPGLSPLSKVSYSRLHPPVDLPKRA